MDHQQLRTAFEIDTIPDIPDFGLARDLFDHFLQCTRHTFNNDQRLMANEAERRLRDVELLAIRIHGQTKSIVERRVESLVTRIIESPGEHTDMLRILKTNGKVRISSLADGWFHTGEDSFDGKEEKEFQMIRLDAELFYYLAHRLITCLQYLPGLKNLKCREVAIVRNQLLEHPEKGQSGILLSSFKFGSDTGPVIKGIRESGYAEVHRDQGFIKNCRVLAECICSALEIS